jgi:hypothetical protein
MMKACHTSGLDRDLIQAMIVNVATVGRIENGETKRGAARVETADAIAAAMSGSRISVVPFPIQAIGALSEGD